MKFVSSFFVVSLVAGMANAASWDIDAAHSSASFKVRHMMISDVRGEFGPVSGKISFDPKDLAKSSLEFTVDVKGIDTRDAKRDEHLRSPEFFDVASFATATFKSKKIAAAGKNKLKVTGELTIHGVAKEITVDADYSDEMKDPWGNTKMGAQAVFKINRQDYKVSWNKALDKGGVVVGDEVEVTLALELQPKK